MEVGIIGGGFTGLSAGYYLRKRGISDTILEKDSIPAVWRSVSRIHGGIGL